MCGWDWLIVRILVPKRSHDLLEVSGGRGACRMHRFERLPISQGSSATDLNHSRVNPAPNSSLA